MRILKKCRDFFRQETVFCVSLVLALLTALVVPPDEAYLAYSDYRTLALLFCLMLIVAGFRSLGIFELLGHILLRRTGSLRGLSLSLTLLCFFSSMVITNDVTLITFVPFTLLVSRGIGREDRILTLVALETIAANLGSMATPIGNPQNLYLYSAAGMSLPQFARAALPYAGLSLILLTVVLAVQKDEPILAAESSQEQNETEKIPKIPLLALLLCLTLCLLVVFRVVGYLPILLCVAAVTAVMNRRLFLSVDYILLLTFVCFFIFVGNLKRLPEVSSLLRALVQGNELLTGILASQVISNVPAAILLSGFTENLSTLLTAVNLGGLGTPIASLASLISFKFCAGAYSRQISRFLKIFTFWNLLFLLILTGAAVLLLMV